MGFLFERKMIKLYPVNLACKTSLLNEKAKRGKDFGNKSAAFFCEQVVLLL